MEVKKISLISINNSRKTSLIINELILPLEVKQKLLAMNIFPGQKIDVIKKYRNKSVLILVESAKILLNEKIASALYVTATE